MDIKQLRYFTVIAEEGQITAAAHRLHIAQPPLSQALKNLENELNTPLFERHPSGLQITEAGSLLLQRSYDVINLMDGIVEELSSFQGGMEGILKIGTVSSAGSVLIDDNFFAFREHYPKIKYRLFEGNSYQIIDYLKKGIIEIGIIRTPFESDNFDMICCKPTPMVAAGHKNMFPFSPDEKVSLKQLINQPIIINRRYHKLLQSIEQQEDFVLQYYCLNNDARTSLYWANSGLGLGIVPKETLELYDYPNLIFAEIDSPELYTQLVAIWIKNKPLSKIAQNFLCYFDNQ